MPDFSHGDNVLNVDSNDRDDAMGFSCSGEWNDEASLVIFYYAVNKLRCSIKKAAMEIQ